jgi:hypothetical protein
VTDAAFDVTVMPTLPLPVPEAGETVAKAAPLDAVHAQLLPFAVMPMRPDPPREP